MTKSAKSTVGEAFKILIEEMDRQADLHDKMIEGLSRDKRITKSVRDKYCAHLYTLRSLRDAMASALAIQSDPKSKEKIDVEPINPENMWVSAVNDSNKKYDISLGILSSNKILASFPVNIEKFSSEETMDDFCDTAMNAFALGYNEALKAVKGE